MSPHAVKNPSVFEKRYLLVDCMESSVKTKYWVYSLRRAEEIWEPLKLWIQFQFKVQQDFSGDVLLNNLFKIQLMEKLSAHPIHLNERIQP